jgi:hypothetical protein
MGDGRADAGGERVHAGGEQPRQFNPNRSDAEDPEDVRKSAPKGIGWAC